MTWPIVTMAIAAEADVVAVRQRARRMAELLGFDRQDQTRIATAVSEIARNAFSYAGGGRAEFLVDADPSPQVFLIRVGDRGRGIADLETIMAGRYRSTSGMGLGLLGARRLMDHFRIESDGQGTLVELGHELPSRAARLTRAMLAELVDTLARERTGDPLAVLREQNRELMQSLDELRRRQEETEQLSQELGNTNRGVVALYSELDDKAEQLRHASEIKTRFLSNLSHEFRTPLNSILALSRLLLDRVDGDLAPEQERQVGYIRRSAEGLLELVNDLLDLAKVEAGKVDVRPVRFTVGELFGALRGALKPLQANTEVELSFGSSLNVVELFTDEGKVAQILRNFISNALKFTEAGEVRVAAERLPDGRIAFTVRDTGIGIAREDQTRIFEEFTQVENRLQKAAKGTGLGLPLSRKLAELLDGEIRVSSELGQGSIFTLVIPPVHDAAAEGAADGNADANRIRVLVVDDDDTFRYVIRQIIGAESRYDIVEAQNGEEGLRRMRGDNPDLVILDLQMPRLDGFAVLRERGSDPALGRIPVIVSTSLAVTPELTSQLPTGIPVLSKHALSRESVSMMLRDTLQSRGRS